MNNINTLIDQFYQTMRSHLQDAKLIVLHPKSRYRSVVLARLLNDPEIATFYYAMNHDDRTLKTFIENATHDLANQHPSFGKHLNMLPQSVYENVSENLGLIQDTFIREISELSDGLNIIVLDEFDHTDEADDVLDFVEGLVDKLPENCHLLLNSRTLPRIPVIAMIARRKAALLLDGDLVERDFYQNYRGENYRLQVFALGPSNVILDNKTVESWEGHLPRLLFFFALDRPIVTRSEICHAFWPELDTDQAVNVFHVTKRRLHKALGLDVLMHNENYYQIDPALGVYYDVLAFVETLMQGRNPNTSSQFDAWQEASRLYRGPFLQGHNEPWIDKRRAAFRVGYLEALTNMATTWIERDKKEMALRLYRQALDEDFSKEEVHRKMMSLYANMGRRAEAVSHFQQIERFFNDQGLKISPETLQLFNDIKA